MLASHEALQADFEEVKRELEWFKKQLVGAKSERRLVEAAPDQLSLGEQLKSAGDSAEPASYPVCWYGTEPDRHAVAF